jgi:hypothetical protein
MAIWHRRDLAVAVVAATSLTAYIFSQGRPTVNQGSTEPRSSLNTTQLPTTSAPVADTFRLPAQLLDEAPQQAALLDDALGDELTPPLPSFRGPEHNPERAALLRETLITRKAEQLSAEGAERPTDETNAVRSPRSTDGALQQQELQQQELQQQEPALRGYVEDVLRTRVVPLLERCYAALTQRFPDALGTLGFSFSILGEQRWGGVVVDVNLTATQSLDDALFRTCLTDSMYALILEAPPSEAGNVSVEQTFELSP